MAWQQSWTPITANATTATSAGLTTTSGNLIVVAHMGNASGAGGETCTDSKSNTYTLLTATTAPSGSAYAIWYCFNIVGGASHTITVACASGGNLVNFVAQEFNSVLTAAAFERSSTVATSATTTPASNSITTTNATDTLIGVLMTDASGAISLGAGYTNLSSNATGQAPRRASMESQVASSTGTYTASWTATGATGSDAYVLAFKNAAAGAARQKFTPNRAAIRRASTW